MALHPIDQAFVNHTAHRREMLELAKQMKERWPNDARFQDDYVNEIHKLKWHIDFLDARNLPHD